MITAEEVVRSLPMLLKGYPELRLELFVIFGEVERMGYWAAMQVKGFRPEITIVPAADVAHLTGGCILITVAGHKCNL